MSKYPGNIITTGADAGYSVFFDGTGDYLTVAANTAFAFGAGDFTWEVWLYRSASATQEIYTSMVTDGFILYILSNKAVVRRFGVSDLLTSSANIDLNTWTHIAVARSGTTLSMWINGSRANGGTVTNSTSFTQNGLRIGINDATANPYTGYMSGLRVVKGTAVYDPTATSINVPTQLFNITNTSLLTCNSPAIVDQGTANSGSGFPITVNGNAAVSTFTPFTGTQLVPNPNTLANTQGVWSISDAAYWMSQNKWPMPPNYPLQSLRFNSADSTVLSRTPASAGNRKIWTVSNWFKKSALSTGTLFSARNGTSGDSFFAMRFESADTLNIFDYTGSALNWQIQTTQVFRDLSAWMHIVLAVDTTQATASNRVKLYINGVQVTALSTSSYPSQNYDCYVNNAFAHSFGASNRTTVQEYFNGYMADINFVDGQALTPSSFGANDPNTGVWSPVPYSGTYGTNGFRLSFQDNTGTTATTLGKDYSGNGNNWTPNNFSVAAGSGNDSLTDGPTNWGIDYGNGGEVRGNYATLNPLKIFSANFNFSNGNLDVTDSGTTNVAAIATMSLPTSGKWYFEATAVAQPSSGALAVGVTNEATATGTSAATFAGAYRSNGAIYNLASVTQTSGATYVANDIIGVAVDVGAGTVKFYKNGVGQGDTPSYSFTAGTVVYPFVAGDNVIGAKAWSMNFGQRPFAYPAPSGFKVLCTTNLPIPTVGATSTTLASKNFNVATYTGTGASQAITGLGFQPDFVWYKDRSNARDHGLFDVVRGATKYLGSNLTNAEQTVSGVTSFDADGFTLGGSINSNNTNETYVAWNWKANGAGVSNTAGSITSTVSANQTAGISVVTWTGNGSNSDQTVGTGLSTALDFIITKPRDTGAGTDSWLVYTSAITLNQNECLILNSTAAKSTTVDQGTPSRGATAGLLLLRAGTGAGVNNQNLNKSGVRYVSYCFHQVAGFSKFGSYTGNGSADGPFVYCGFRPRYVMLKSSSNGAVSWWVLDSARNAYNLTDIGLFPNLSSGDNSSVTASDFLSNGFKIRSASTEVNQSTGTYIFMAFAESPFNYSRAR